MHPGAPARGRGFHLFVVLLRRRAGEERQSWTGLQATTAGSQGRPRCENFSGALSASRSTTCSSAVKQPCSTVPPRFRCSLSPAAVAPETRKPAAGPVAAARAAGAGGPGGAGGWAGGGGGRAG